MQLGAFSIAGNAEVLRERVAVLIEQFERFLGRPALPVLRP
ncbi:MAG: hypothetical protein ACOY5V_01620 [Pseudomonadota bacterium]